MKTTLYLSAAALTLAVISFSCSKSEGASADKKNASIDSTSYPLYAIKAQPLENVLRLPAQFSAYEEVSIYPKVTGYIKKMNVDIGSVVKEGEIIMEMEAPEIEQNELAAHERFLKAQAAFEASKDSYERLLHASKTAGAVSPNDLETAHSTMLSDKALCNSENASWKAMETLKDYLIVKAPFDGTITQRNIHPGALVTMGTKTDGTPMLELQQISRLRLQVKVPETSATQLSPDEEVSFTVEALPGKVFTGKIARQANSLDEKYRSEAVEIDVMNPEKIFMPGMYAEILLPVAGHSNALIVPQTAVVTSTEKKYVVKVSGHIASIVDVTTGNENNGLVEIFGKVATADSVIAAAADNIKQGQYINY
jgi:membrane fusion protein (multidrug efflux system)